MYLIGQLKVGESVGNWATLGQFDAETLEGLTTADSAAVQRATQECSELVLRDGNRVFWRWSGGECALPAGIGETTP